jgi:hypothetical protein
MPRPGAASSSYGGGPLPARVLRPAAEAGRAGEPAGGSRVVVRGRRERTVADVVENAVEYGPGDARVTVAVGAQGGRDAVAAWPRR